MDIFRIIGIIAVGIAVFGLLITFYHIVRGFVLACDFVLWQLYTARQNDPTIKFEFGKFFRGVGKNWVDMIGYTPESFTCQRGSSIWSGYGTGRGK